MPATDGRAPSIADPPRQTAPAAMWRAGAGSIGHWIEDRLDRERDQLPLWIPVGFGLGISAWIALPDANRWIAFLLASAAGLIAALAFGRGTRWGRALAIFFMAALLGCAHIWIRSERVAAPRLEREQLAAFTATIDTVQRLPAREAVRLILKPDAGSGLPRRLRVNVDQDDATSALQPGATIRLRAWLMPPAPMAVPGSYDFARAAWFQGIGGTGRVLGTPEVIAPPAGVSLWARIGVLRQRLADHVRSSLGEEAEAGIAAALATGDQGAISEADAEAMRRAGLAHLLSVSGLHLTAVVGAVMFLTLKLLALSPSLALRLPLTLIAAATGAIAGVAYTLLTGAEVPTVRACIAALLILAGLALGRDAFTMRLLAVGALVVLLLWPESLAGPSFQLSFAAIAAIVALHEHPKVQQLLARREDGLIQSFGRLLLGLLLTGLAVELALMPIALFHFHKSGLYGALANIVAIPLTTFIIMPFEALALLLDLAGLGAPIWWLVAKALQLLLALAHATANAPGAVAMMPTMPRPAFALMVGGGLWLILWRSGWRLWGLVPIAAGLIWAASMPAPDVIVTGDGRHLALRSASGEMAILRGKAGDYVRDLLSESAGTEAELLDLDEAPGARCSRDLCTADLWRNGRRWRILATRTPHLVPIGALAEDCREADIVISDRRLPFPCKPRWLKADRVLLNRTGGLSIVLGEEAHVTTVAQQVGRHPWSTGSESKKPRP